MKQLRSPPARPNASKTTVCPLGLGTDHVGNSPHPSMPAKKNKSESSQRVPFAAAGGTSTAQAAAYVDVRVPDLPAIASWTKAKHEPELKVRGTRFGVNVVPYPHFPPFQRALSLVITRGRAGRHVYASFFVVNDFVAVARARLCLCASSVSAQH